MNEESRTDCQKCTAQVSAPEALRTVAAVLADTPSQMVPLSAVLMTLYETADRIEAGELNSLTDRPTP